MLSLISFGFKRFSLTLHTNSGVSLFSELLKSLLTVPQLELNYILPVGMIFVVVVYYFLGSSLNSRINLKFGVHRQGIELLVHHL